ncbi:membrane-bound lytic murein transglycosylase MltF [Ferrimonas marina]|uniref:Membrane-bound lytic murein transglycosylase F n=1 Tax=Ferrimonas marina TaxID=299255 RepID=A0A1M5RUE9_9GAMM|nr:membrane-bound lytic murein transglycosylase MltF [Ferrimonas marina]SHH29789.1 membrane-bound lytic murein transglycosylase F [Ferrimonas marina]
MILATTRRIFRRLCRSMRAPLLLCLPLTGCLEFVEPPQATTPSLPNPLLIGTLTGPTTYQSRGQGPEGFDYEVAMQFGQYLGVETAVVPYSDLAALFEAMESGEIHLMAAGLNRTPERAQRWHFGPPLYQVETQLIYRVGQRRPKDLASLDGTLRVVKGSSRTELLRRAQQTLPNLQWQETDEFDDAELLAQVAEGSLDYTLVDNRVLALYQRRHPELRTAFNLGQPLPVAWALPHRNDGLLLSALLEFWDSELTGGRLARLEEKYFGHVERFDYVDTRAFIRAVEKTLPRYQQLFQRHAGELDWRKLAAVSYQESHWDPLARSPTGVRGMMMLTESTARRMGIRNRLDAEQSIQGGSGYLQQLITRLPPNIPEDEAIWFALAAYNIGLGHLEDARVITQRHGFDPNSWRDVKKHLPLLRQRKHYERTKYGFARGDEAAHYVENIRRYYDTLLWIDSQTVAEHSEGDPEQDNRF